MDLNELLTKDQSRLMEKHNLSIPDMLNGRTGLSKEKIVFSIYKEWNHKLGFIAFGA